MERRIRRIKRLTQCRHEFLSVIVGLHSLVRVPWVHGLAYIDGTSPKKFLSFRPLLQERVTTKSECGVVCTLIDDG